MIRHLKISALKIPFRQGFRHASAERRITQSIWVEVTLDGGARGYGEGCPREYVTGESIDSSVSFLRRIEPMLSDIDGVASLGQWVRGNREMIDAAPAAWCALELALLDAMSRQTGETVESMLGICPVREWFSYSAVLGAESKDKFEAQFQKYREMGFRDYKVKLTGDDGDSGRMAVLGSHPGSFDSLRLDTNNRWLDPGEAIRYLSDFSSMAYAVEEPVSAGDVEGALAVAESTGLRVILDESCLCLEDLEPLASHPEVWIANLRISKMGGMFRSLEFAKKACHLGIPLIVGCQVGETSLLTRAALSLVSSQPADAVLAQEGAFGTLLLSADIVESPLQFGHGGILDVASRGFGRAPGFGLDVNLPEGM
jgi:L-alanine-DL-glutamate epimerase-like enolase superfamily enzyme